MVRAFGIKIETKSQGEPAPSSSESIESMIQKQIKDSESEFLP